MRKRDRELERLRFGGSLVFLSAQSGYGKTQLMRDYCNEDQLEPIWYTCTGKESDWTIVDDWPEAFQHGLVFEHFERIGGHYVLEKLVERLERESLRVFFLSRHQPPREFARWQAEGRLCVISQQELTFSREELSRETYEATLGYPVALHFYEELFEASANAPAPTLQQLLVCSPVSDYLGNELFARLNARERAFLAKICVGEELTAELCEQVFLISDGKRQLEAMTRKNICQVAWENGQPVWRIMPFFKAYLRERFAGSAPSLQMERLTRFHLSKQQYETAVVLAENHKEAAVQVLELGGRKLLEQENHQRLGHLLTLVRGQELSIPALETAVEYYYRTGQYELMFSCLNQADSRYGSENKFSAYRTLYRGLIQYQEDPLKAERHVNNVIFYLKENQLPLPYLTEEHKRLLDYLLIEKDEVRKSQQKPLTVRMFGGFSLEVTEQHQEISWRTKKGCELFAFLMVHQNDAVDRRQILTALWEDEIPNSAVAMLHNMLYHLRKELSSYKLDQVVVVQNKKYSLDFSMIASDYDRIRQVVSLVEKKRVEELREYKELFDTYWGGFMEEFESRWAREHSSFYERIYQEGAALLIKDCMNRKEYEQAKPLLISVLGRNPYAEEFMCELLICQKELGDLIGMKKEYQIFCDRLYKDLKVSPGKELSMLYHQLVP